MIALRAAWWVAGLAVTAAVLAPGGWAGEPQIAPERIIEHELDKAESHALTPRRNPHVGDRLRAQDLKATEQRLRTLQTDQPTNAELPLLERQFDRLQRPTRILRP